MLCRIVAKEAIETNRSSRLVSSMGLPSRLCNLVHQSLSGHLDCSGDRYDTVTSKSELLELYNRSESCCKAKTRGKRHQHYCMQNASLVFERNGESNAYAYLYSCWGQPPTVLQADREAFRIQLSSWQQSLHGVLDHFVSENFVSSLMHSGQEVVIIVEGSYLSFLCLLSSFLRILRLWFRWF